MIFENLIKNSLDHNPGKDVNINISGTIDSYKNYTFTVSDNGIGIDPKYKDKVFEMFQTLETKDKIGKIGNGLFLVKKMVTKLNGKIWINTAPRKGLQIIFILPQKM